MYSPRFRRSLPSTVFDLANQAILDAPELFENLNFVTPEGPK